MSQLDTAMSTPLFISRGIKLEGIPETFQSASALYYLTHYGIMNGFTRRVKTRVLQHLRNMIAPGREPSCDCQHYWHYPLLAASVTLAKNTPELWDEFTEDEVARFDTLMEGFAYSSNFAVNDSNDYHTGFAFRGGTGKKFNPNFKLSLVAPIVFSTIYFGGADIMDAMLTDYSYDAFIEKLNRFGFKNMLDVWGRADFERGGQTFPGVKTLSENGGPAYIVKDGNVFRGGSGVGVKVPFLYRGYRADETAVIEFLLYDCYNGGPVFSHTDDNGDGTYDAYIADETASPMEGKLGMMLEFNSVDKSGIRSDAGYCKIDFVMVVAIVSALKRLGLWSESECAQYPLMQVGNRDLMYKLEHGYVSYSLGRQHTVFADNRIGYDFMKEIWMTYFEV